MLFKIATCLMLTTVLLAANNKKQVDIAKVSEAFGQLIGKNLDTLGVDYDLELVIKGLKDAKNGNKHLMTEAECIETLTTAQELAFEKQATTNLEKAETFLQKNAKEKNMVVLEEGKVQYKIEKKGDGATVNSDATPLICYVGKYLDGSAFGASESQTISLSDAIRGFSKGIVGMKEGEKRILFIHPDYAYGTNGLLPPNSLLTFEVEVVKAHVEPEPITDSLILDSDHISTPDLDSPAVR